MLILTCDPSAKSAMLPLVKVVCAVYWTVSPCTDMVLATVLRTSIVPYSTNTLFAAVSSANGVTPVTLGAAAAQDAMSKAGIGADKIGWIKASSLLPL